MSAPVLQLLVAPALVAAATLAARRFSPRVGGVVSAFPAIVGPVLLIGALLRGTLAGMGGFVAFCALVALLAEPAGTAAAFTSATLAAVVVQAAAAWAPARPRRLAPATG